MPNDTPPHLPESDAASASPLGAGSDGEESQDPFISERNEPDEPSVHNHMSDTTPDTPIPVDQTDDATVAVETGEMIVEPASVSTQDSTVFMAADEPLSDPATPEAVTPDAMAHDDGLRQDEPFVVTVPVSPVGQPTRDDPPTGGRSGTSMLMFILAAVVSGIVGALLTYATLAATGTFDTETAPAPTVVTTTVASTPIVTTSDGGTAVNPTAVAEKVMPSIVTVNVYEGLPDSPEGRIGTGSGSGVVMSSDGYLITNHHVIDGADSYDVTFEDGRTYEAELIGSDGLTDLAVLRISADGLVPIAFGSADALSIGDPAIAVGNPLGQEGGASITVGIVSAFDRRVDFADDTSLFGMIQTDAAINSGSSGGALVNAEGSLVGITSAIGVSTAGPEGIGYAIPIELVDRITAEIIETGDVRHPFLGVNVQTFFDTASDGAVFPAGAIIESIEGADSAAGAAGIRAGDVVVNIGGETITSQTDLILEVRLYRVGDAVNFTVDRDTELLQFEVILGQRPPEFRG